MVVNRFLKTFNPTKFRRRLWFLEKHYLESPKTFLNIYTRYSEVCAMSDDQYSDYPQNYKLIKNQIAVIKGYFAILTLQRKMLLN